MKKIDTTGWSRMDYIRFYMDVWQVPVIPVAENKKPLIRWSTYQTRMPTREEIDEWFVSRNPWGLAIVLKGGLFSVDMDTDELYKNLKEMGAFPRGSCVYKSRRGFHSIMRATGGLFSVAEHNENLPNELQELGIGGDRHLANVPDTPHRSWVVLYDEPVAVDFEPWVMKYIGEPKEMKRSGMTRDGWMPEILCPWHELDGNQHTPSLHPNKKDGAFICHGCGRTGTFTELANYSKNIGYQLPNYIYQWVEDYKRDSSQSRGELNMDKKLVYRADEALQLEELPEALIKGVGWRGDIIELYGAPGTGKTSLMTSGAADLATGEVFWGDWKVAKPCRVLYIDTENPPGETRMAIQAATGENKRALKLVDIAELIGIGFNISNPEWQKWLNDQISRNKYDVVIGDNLGKMTGKNIIDDYEMRQVIAIIRPIVRKHNILFFLIHHTGWARFDNQGRQLPSHGKGGSSLLEDVNACFEVVKTSKHITRITIKKIRSRRAAIASGDEFVHYYDPKTMRIVPAELRMVIQKVKWLVGKYGLPAVADKLGCNKSSVSRYMHGYRQPDNDIRGKLEEVIKAEGYKPQIGDVI